MSGVRSSDGTTIAFDRSGDGPAIILVGAAFRVRSDPRMVQLSALLAPRFTVFNYDRRGRGESGDTAPYPSSARLTIFRPSSPKRVARRRSSVVPPATGDLSLSVGLLGSVAVPTLALDGGASPGWMRNGVRAVAEVLPNAPRGTLEGQTHDLAPEVLAPVLAEFLAG